MSFLGSGLTVAAVILTMIPLGAMLGYVLTRGASALNLAFFTSVPPGPDMPGGGMLPQILGTLELIGLASMIGVPVGIASGIYLARSAGGQMPGFGRFAHTVRFVTDVIAGTPSIVAGVVAYGLVVIPMHTFSGLSGGVALALLMFPTVTRATEEAIRLVPASIREAALALGLPEWKTMVRIILPTAISGIVTAVMLGVARVAGETAPLVFTALTNSAVETSPLRPMASLPVQIWNYATSPYSNWQAQAWAGAFVLFAIIVILNVAARLLTRRLTARVSQA